MQVSGRGEGQPGRGGGDDAGARDGDGEAVDEDERDARANRALDGLRKLTRVVEPVRGNPVDENMEYMICEPCWNCIRSEDSEEVEHHIG